MRYSVSIGFNEFIFSDGKEALDFANLAARHMVEPEGFVKNDVIIMVTDKKEENNNGMDV